MTKTWLWPLVNKNPVPTGAHPGAFGTDRKHDIHTGVDLYCDEHDPVFAVESGVVVKRGIFTGPYVGSPWWNTTQYTMVEGESGVVCYGEIYPILYEVGTIIHMGYIIGSAQTVLKKDKGLPMTMLHLELYKHGTRDIVSWSLGEPQPPSLLDPTGYLL